MKEKKNDIDIYRPNIQLEASVEQREATFTGSATAPFYDTIKGRFSTEPPHLSFAWHPATVHVSVTLDPSERYITAIIEPSLNCELQTPINTISLPSCSFNFVISKSQLQTPGYYNLSIQPIDIAGNTGAVRSVTWLIGQQTSFYLFASHIFIFFFVM